MCFCLFAVLVIQHHETEHIVNIANKQAAEKNTPQFFHVSSPCFHFKVKLSIPYTGARERYGARLETKLCNTEEVSASTKAEVVGRNGVQERHRRGDKTGNRPLAPPIRPHTLVRMVCCWFLLWSMIVYKRRVETKQCGG